MVSKIVCNRYSLVSKNNSQKSPLQKNSQNEISGLGSLARKQSDLNDISRIEQTFVSSSAYDRSFNEKAVYPKSEDMDSNYLDKSEVTDESDPEMSQSDRSDDQIAANLNLDDLLGKQCQLNTKLTTYLDEIKEDIDESYLDKDLLKQSSQDEFSVFDNLAMESSKRSEVCPKDLKKC